MNQKPPTVAIQYHDPRPELHCLGIMLSFIHPHIYAASLEDDAAEAMVLLIEAEALYHLVDTNSIADEPDEHEDAFSMLTRPVQSLHQIAAGLRRFMQALEVSHLLDIAFCVSRILERLERFTLRLDELQRSPASRIPPYFITLLPHYMEPNENQPTQ